MHVRDAKGTIATPGNEYIYSIDHVNHDIHKIAPRFTSEIYKIDKTTGNKSLYITIQIPMQVVQITKLEE